MASKDPFEQGYAFASKMLGGNVGAVMGASYTQRITSVEQAINDLNKALMSAKNEAGDAQLGGFMAEAWHAGTFKVDAAANGSSNYATAGQSGTEGALGRNNYASVDIRIQNKQGKAIKDYSSKYMANAKETAKEQGRPSKYWKGLKYDGQDALVPADQLKDVKGIAEKRTADSQTPENWKEGYKHVKDTATDKISDGKSESKPLSKQESMDLAKETKDGEVDVRKHGVSNELLSPSAIMAQATKAGLTSAAISALIQAAPDIYKSIDYLIKHKELNAELLKQTGTKAISAGAEGFIIGSTACILQIKMAEGAFGAPLQQAILGPMGATILGSAVALTYATIKNSILVASGKMSKKEMASSLVDSIAISTGFVAGAYIGGVIGQILGFTAPVAGFLLGSLIGSSFSILYGIGKQKLISFCVDSGFACFGLVEQDYIIPAEALKDMGIDVTEISRIEISRLEVERTNISSPYQQERLETINIKMLRRGIIEINKVGYLY